MEENQTSKYDNSVLLEWEAPSRPFKKQSQEFYRTVGSLAFLVIVILFFVREFLLIGVIIATLFVMYVLSSVPPEHLKNKITKLGIQTGEHFHKWDEMHNFWLDERHGQSMLVVRMLIGFPSHLQLMLGDVPFEMVKKILVDHMPVQDKPERTFLDNAADWLSSKIPLERLS